MEQRDTLWRIADKSLGDPRRWHEIYALNSHRVQPDGTHLTEAAVLHVGWTLLLPDDAPPAERSRPESGPPATPGTAQVVVAPGDTLTKIAAEHLGTSARYREIYQTNHDRRQPDGAALHDPDLIRPGWILTLPSPTPAPPATGPVTPEPLSPDPPTSLSPSPSPPPITEVSLRRPQIRPDDVRIHRFLASRGTHPRRRDHHRDLTTGARDRRDRGADPLVGIRHHGRSSTDSQLNPRSDEHAGRTGRKLEDGRSCIG